MAELPIYTEQRTSICFVCPHHNNNKCKLQNKRLGEFVWIKAHECPDSPQRWSAIDDDEAKAQAVAILKEKEKFLWNNHVNLARNGDVVLYQRNNNFNKETACEDYRNNNVETYDSDELANRLPPIIANIKKDSPQDEIYLLKTAAEVTPTLGDCGCRKAPRTN